MNIKIFVDADDDDRLMRIIVRNMMERASDAIMSISLYDIIIPQGGHNKVAVDVIKATVDMALKNK